jgi:hypothetical protein
MHELIVITAGVAVLMVHVTAFEPVPHVVQTVPPVTNPELIAHPVGVAAAVPVAVQAVVRLLPPVAVAHGTHVGVVE